MNQLVLLQSQLHTQQQWRQQLQHQQLQAQQQLQVQQQQQLVQQIHVQRQQQQARNLLALQQQQRQQQQQMLASGMLHNANRTQFNPLQSSVNSQMTLGGSVVLPTGSSVMVDSGVPVSDGPSLERPSSVQQGKT